MSGSDIIVVGSGPAGVSAAFPLVEAGLQVLMIDGGREPAELPPGESYLDLRDNSASQWKIFLGEGLHALAATGVNSPKFRAGTLAPVFEGFREAYRADLEDFALVGSLAAGGLSSAWGAGVAAYTDDDLAGFPIKASDLAPSYLAVTKRIGVSGVADDDLRELFGWDIALQPPTGLDSNAEILMRRYNERPARARNSGLRLGRARNAVLTRPLDGREACDRSTLCLWGCGRRAIYSARYDLERLLAHPNCKRIAAVVSAVRTANGRFSVEGRLTRDGSPVSADASRMILACGAVGTAKLVFDLVGHRDKAVPLLSTPSAAFALLFPGRLGRAIDPQGFGLAQLSFSIDLDGADRGPAFGNLFGTAGLPVYEFARHAPVSRLAALHLFRLLLPAMLVGNCFLPGEYSAHRLTLGSDGRLSISGAYRDDAASSFADVRRRLALALLKYGIVMLPGSFSCAEQGSDAHYAGTVPMKSNPAPHEAGRDGEVAGAPGLYVVDGAALTRLSAKAHTLTIMANADRIGRAVAGQFRN